MRGIFPAPLSLKGFVRPSLSVHLSVCKHLLVVHLLEEHKVEIL